MEGDPRSAELDTDELRMELRELISPLSPREQKVRVQHLLDVTMPRVERDFQQGLKHLQSVPDTAPGPPDTPTTQIVAAIERGEEVYSGVKVPVLAIFADPHALPANAPKDPAKRAAMTAEDRARTSEEADAFKAGNPQARVVEIPNANHVVFQSNEAEVLGDMNAFIRDLP